MSTPETRHAGRREGEARKTDAHYLLGTRCGVPIRRARRALHLQLLEVGSATAADVADRIGSTRNRIDPRWRGAVPRSLPLAGIIRRAGYTKSARPSRHASVLTVWELADRGAALAWLARNPDLPEPDDEAGAPSPPVRRDRHPSL
jgi:hypothetical protein